MAGMLIKMACVVMACMVVLAPHAEAAITCGQVTANLAGCLSYLRMGGAVTPICCNGVKGLKNAVATPADRRTACNCIKRASANFPGINPANAASLPGKCGVSIPYKISPNTDCSRIN